MAEITFIKLSVNTFSDDKVQIIESMPEGKSILIVFIKLLCWAGRNNQSGLIQINEKIGYTPEMLSTILREKQSVVMLAIQTLQTFGMLEIYEAGQIEIVNWSKHQNTQSLELVREKNRERQKRHRENNKMLLSSNVTVTPQSRYSNSAEEEKENKKGESKKREKEIIYPELSEVKTYFAENKFTEQLAERFFNYYTASDWKDKEGKSVKVWKQKAQTWFSHNQKDKVTETNDLNDKMKRVLIDYPGGEWINGGAIYKFTDNVCFKRNGEFIMS